MGSVTNGVREEKQKTQKNKSRYLRGCRLTSIALVRDGSGTRRLTSIALAVAVAIQQRRLRLLGTTHPPLWRIDPLRIDPLQIDPLRIDPLLLPPPGCANMPTLGWKERRRRW